MSTGAASSEVKVGQIYSERDWASLKGVACSTVHHSALNAFSLEPAAGVYVSKILAQSDQIPTILAALLTDQLACARRASLYAKSELLSRDAPRAARARAHTDRARARDERFE